MKAALIGHPVAHSLSPLIHRHWLAQYNIQGTYGTVDVAAGTLAAATEQMIAEGYSGFNVTLPYKRDIMELCAAIDGAAQAVGAVNTVVIRDGQLYGLNTDAAGFVRSLGGLDLSGGTVVILGAGGGARAIAHGVRQVGAGKVIVCARQPEKAENFADEALPWAGAAAAMAGARLLVNATPLGMAGHDKGADAHALPDLAALPSGAVVCDIVYRPLTTPLLRAAADRGLQTIDGLGMLLHQAAGAFAQWTGIMPDVTEELRRKVMEAAR